MSLIFAWTAVLCGLIGLSVDWFHLYSLVWSLGVEPAMFVNACGSAAATAVVLSVLLHRSGSGWGW